MVQNLLILKFDHSKVPFSEVFLVITVVLYWRVPVLTTRGPYFTEFRAINFLGRRLFLGVGLIDSSTNGINSIQGPDHRLIPDIKSIP